MSEQTYHGSCHCGAVRFRARIDLDRGTLRCNCSYCAKARTWFALIGADAIEVDAADDAQQAYEWVPPGQAHANLRFRFCRTCGVRTPGFGDQGPPDGGPFCFVPVALLDDADPQALARSLRYVDGRHGRYDQTPSDTRLM